MYGKHFLNKQLETISTSQITSFASSSLSASHSCSHGSFDSEWQWRVWRQKSSKVERNSETICTWRFCAPLYKDGKNESITRIVASRSDNHHNRKPVTTFLLSGRKRMQTSEEERVKSGNLKRKESNNNVIQMATNAQQLSLGEYPRIFSR